jgi:formylglycine-generating enzyme required for sulfatase activity
MEFSSSRPKIVPNPSVRWFTDCGSCPVMVIVPTGSFMMGSVEEEAQRGSDEGPQRQVTMTKVFAASRFPVTFDQWDYCVAQGGCAENSLPSDAGWGRGSHPVINVSWNDANAYIAWLNKSTGKKYRLLTEVEREYITRAGTTAPFWWGDSVTTDQANYRGEYTYGPRSKIGLYRKETTPVDTFDPNPWSFYQVAGNVWDWVEDCYQDSFTGAPTNGSAWTSGDCGRRVLRGGSWGSQPRNLRSAARYRLPPDSRDSYYSFRVARDVAPGE